MFEIDFFVSAGVMQYTVGFDMFVAVFTFGGADYEVKGNLPYAGGYLCVVLQQPDVGAACCVEESKGNQGLRGALTLSCSFTNQVLAQPDVFRNWETFMMLCPSTPCADSACCVHEPGAGEASCVGFF